MKTFIESYLLDQTQRLVFLTLREDVLNDPRQKNLKNIPIPIFVEQIPSFGKKDSTGIPAKEIAKAMMYMMGIDADFKYHLSYVDFVRAFTDSPLNFAKELIITSYRNHRLMDSIIYTRAYIYGFAQDEDFLFNYGALCEEYAAQIEDEDKKNAFALEAKKQLYPFIGKKIEQALEAIEIQQWEQAKRLLKEVLRKNDRDFDAYFYLGYVHRLNADYDKALDYYEKAYELDNKVARLINEMALCFSFGGDFEQALELFLYAHSLEKNSVEILCNLSMIYLNMDDLDKARYYALQAEKINPEDRIAQACFKEIRKYESSD